jgi:hypothetical protein
MAVGVQAPQGLNRGPLFVRTFIYEIQFQCERTNKNKIKNDILNITADQFRRLIFLPLAVLKGTLK